MKKDQDRFDKKPKKLKHSKNVPGEGMRTIGRDEYKGKIRPELFEEDLGDGDDYWGNDETDIQDNNEE